MKLVILLLVFGFSAVQAQPAVVNGSFPTWYTGKSLQLILMNYENRNDKKVQDQSVGQDGTFSFTIPLDDAAIFTLRVQDSSVMQILAKPGDRIGLQIRKEAIMASGSADTQYLVDYEANRKLVFGQFLQRTYDSSAVAVKLGDKEKIAYWNAEHEKSSEKYKATLALWVKQPFFMHSLAVVHHSLRWNSDQDIALMNEIVENLQKQYPKAELTRQLVSKVNATQRIAIGATAPAFETTNTQGKLVALKSYRGKYTLVDFWASWCSPCRAESPNLVRLYHTYHTKGFDILSISIDKDEAKWKNAVTKDGYLWENVSDLAGYSGATPALYTVTAIPNNLLLNKDGKIIAKNLRGKALEEKLKELLGENQ